MPILKDIDVDGPIVDLPIVSLHDWDVAGRPTDEVGVRLEESDHADAIGDSAAALRLIVLTFPKFSDGRAYTTARLLREAWGFTGELRGAGDVLIDQYAFMRMSGIDAVETESPVDSGRWDAAARRIGGWYQDISNARDRTLFASIARARHQNVSSEPWA